MKELPMKIFEIYISNIKNRLYSIVSNNQTVNMNLFNIYHNGKNSQFFTTRCKVMLIYHSDYMDIICLYNATVSVEYFVHTTYFIGN